MEILFMSIICSMMLVIPSSSEVREEAKQDSEVDYDATAFNIAVGVCVAIWAVPIYLILFIIATAMGF